MLPPLKGPQFSQRDAVGAFDRLPVSFGMAAQAMREDARSYNAGFSIHQWHTIKRLKNLEDGAIVSREDANERGKPYDLKFESDVNEAYLSFLIDEKERERLRQSRLDRFFSEDDRGPLSKGAVFGVGFVEAMLDPLNIAASFIPVVRESKMQAMIARQGRHLARLRVGAAEGFVGSAALEPIVTASAKARQADYEMADSLVNIAFGTVAGGGLHVGVGAMGDALQYASPRIRQGLLRTAVGQLADDRPVDVLPLATMDREIRELLNEEGEVLESPPDMADVLGMRANMPNGDLRKGKMVGDAPEIVESEDFSELNGRGTGGLGHRVKFREAHRNKFEFNKSAGLTEAMPLVDSFIEKFAELLPTLSIGGRRWEALEALVKIDASTNTISRPKALLVETAQLLARLNIKVEDLEGASVFGGYEKAVIVLPKASKDEHGIALKFIRNRQNQGLEHIVPGTFRAGTPESLMIPVYAQGYVNGTKFAITRRADPTPISTRNFAPGNFELDKLLQKMSALGFAPGDFMRRPDNFGIDPADGQLKALDEGVIRPLEDEMGPNRAQDLMQYAREKLRRDFDYDTVDLDNLVYGEARQPPEPRGPGPEAQEIIQNLQEEVEDILDALEAGGIDENDLAELQNRLRGDQPDLAEALASRLRNLGVCLNTRGTGSSSVVDLNV